MGIKNTIVMAAGGTGGHVFPAISVASKLSQRYNIVFSTDKRGIKYLDGQFAIVCNIATNNRLYLYISLIANTLQAAVYLFKNKKSIIAVVGFGGYPSVPFTLASKIVGIKTIIHEQNAVIGRANKLLSIVADKIILSFNNAKLDKKAIHIGNPTRFDDIYNDFVYKPSKKDKQLKIFVIGGSQGSKLITEIASESICNLVDCNIYVYHQARTEDIKMVSDKYQKRGIKNITKAFFNSIEMENIYKDVDIVIGRSGASTIFELIGFKLPSILIPYANSMNGDQLANAKILEDVGASIVVSEKDLSTNKLVELIKNIHNDKDILINMSNAISQNLYIENVSQKFADEVVKVVDA